MSDVILSPNIDDPDDIYQLIIDMHEGMSDEESERANAKLILILANHIGDRLVLEKAAQIVRENTLNSR